MFISQKIKSKWGAKLPHSLTKLDNGSLRFLKNKMGGFLECELLRASHSVGEANYHIQMTVAYRRQIFRDETTKVLTRDYILAAARQHGITISGIGFGTEHCHVFTTSCKNHSPAEVARLLKGFSSYMMRKHHVELFSAHLWGSKFWSGGYFYRTVGAVNSRTIKRYVEDTQEKHWKVQLHTQKTLFQFSAS